MHPTKGTGYKGQNNVIFEVSYWKFAYLSLVLSLFKSTEVYLLLFEIALFLFSHTYELPW